MHKLITDSERFRIDAIFQQVLTARQIVMIHPLLTGSRGVCREVTMHQDQRIGLALGVMLVGACAAFFFRNESRVLPDVPRLKNAQELDQRIAERSTRPYTSGIEAVEIADRRGNHKSNDAVPASSSSNAEQSQIAAWNPMSLLNGTAVRETSKRELPTSSNATLAQTHADTSGLAPEPSNSKMPLRVRSDSDLVAAETELTTAQASSSSNLSQSGTRTYVVQKGETLSSIAAKTLGDRSRFQDLFVANQDQLTDANDVKPGMELRIPDSGKTDVALTSISRSRHPIDKHIPSNPTALAKSDRPSQALPPAADTKLNRIQSGTRDLPHVLLSTELPATVHRETLVSPQKADNAVSNPKRFVPAKQLPFSRQATTQGNPVDLRDFAGKKLSQNTLESTSGKIAR